jgi:hypothetical protein
MLPAAPDATGGAWPVTISGWVALVTSIVTAITVLIGAPVAWGRWIQKINGLGERLKLVEDAQKESKGAEMERVRQFDEVMHEQRTIIAAIGRAEKSSESCREEIDQHALALGSLVSGAVTKMGAMELHLSQRLTAVETALNLRGSK